MARDFTGSTSDRLAYSGTLPETGLWTFTFAAWAKHNSTGGEEVYFGWTRGTGGPFQGYWFYKSVDDKLAGTVAASSTSATSTPTNTLSSGVYYHVCCTHAVLGGSDEMHVILDGDWSDRVGVAHARVPSGLNYCSVGGLRLNATNYSPIDGLIAWPCLWDVRLSQGEIEALAAGAHPLTIRPESIVNRWLFGGGIGDEPDTIGTLPLSEAGAVGTGESPLVTLGWPLAVQRVAAAAGGPVPLEGSIPSLSTLSGTAALAQAIGATLPAVSGGSSNLLLAQAIEALLASQSTVSGSLTLTQQIEALIASQSAVSATPSLSISVAGSIVSVSTVDGTAILAIDLQSGIDGISTISGDLEYLSDFTLDAVINALSTISATPKLAIAMGSSISSVSSVAASLRLALGLDSSIDAVSQLDGTLSFALGLGASISSVSTVSGTATIFVQIGSTIDVVSSVQGVLKLAQGLATTLTAQSGGTVNLAVQYSITSTVAGLSTVSAALTVPAGEVPAGTSPDILLVSDLNIYVNEDETLFVSGASGDILIPASKRRLH